MSIQKALTISCDGGDLPEGGEISDFIRCRATFSDLGIPQSNAEVRRSARQSGWKTKGFDYCPTHAWMAS